MLSTVLTDAATAWQRVTVTGWYGEARVTSSWPPAPPCGITPACPSYRCAGCWSAIRSVATMDVDNYRAASRGSPMKRAEPRGLKRKAAVVLGNVGTLRGAPVL